MIRSPRPLRELRASQIAAAAVISALVTLALLVLRGYVALESLELSAYDWYLRLQPQSVAGDRRIVLITISEQDIRNQGRWPLSDAALAQILETLARHRPRVIGLDIYRDVPVPPGREELNAVLAANPRIIAVMKFGGGLSDGIPPPPVLRDTDRVGFNDVLVDPGGTVRRGLLFLDDGETAHYSFALRLALLYLRADGITPRADERNPAHVTLGRTTIRPFAENDGGYVGADARGYQFLLDFQSLRGSFASFSLTSLLSERIDPAALEDRIVLVGVVAEGVKDFFYTPHSRGLHGTQDIPGIALHGNVVSQLLRIGADSAKPIGTLSDWQEGVWIALWSLLGGVLGLRVRSPFRFSLAAGFGALLLGLADYAAFWAGWWIPLVPPGIGWVSSSALVTAYISHQEKEERVLLMHLFSRHVSKEIVDVIWSQRDQFLEGGRPRPQRLVATVLFTDLVGFTTVTEKSPPQALVDWLNEYMEEMARRVLDHRGLVNKYIGDSVMAVFGAPVPRTTDAEIAQDAVNAVTCAIAMERGLLDLNRRWQATGLPTTGMRIGIATGPVVAGSIGSARRLEYTVIGDTVNTAARLESYDKERFVPDPLGGASRILIDESTLRHLGDQFVTKRVGEVRLKGQEHETTIYQVVGQEKRA